MNDLERKLNVNIKDNIIIRLSKIFNEVINNIFE